MSKVEDNGEKEGINDRNDRGGWLFSSECTELIVFSYSTDTAFL